MHHNAAKERAALASAANKQEYEMNQARADHALAKWESSQAEIQRLKQQIRELEEEN
jgi:polyhydroxyalkanoate synthesis regulator phasin